MRRLKDLEDGGTFQHLGVTNFLEGDLFSWYLAVSAGDNLEALMAAHGSGALERTKSDPRRIANVDIGGGTTKIALCAGVEVVRGLGHRCSDLICALVVTFGLHVGASRRAGDVCANVAELRRIPGEPFK